MSTTTDNPEPFANYSRRPLSEEKKRKILAMIINGSSRRKAAAYVGCSPSTITRIALRDPEFGERLSSAEQSAEIIALGAIRRAGQIPRHWRAAAWLLERKYPEEFGKRPPLLMTTEHLRKIFGVILNALEEAVPEGKWDIVLDKFDEYLDRAEEEHVSISPPPLPNNEGLHIKHKHPDPPNDPSFPAEHPANVLDEFADFDDHATAYDEKTSDVRQ